SRKARPSVFAGPHTAPVAVRRSPEGRAEPFLLPTPSPGRPAPEVSVIIPVHDEQENVRPLCETVVHALEELGRTWEMIVVDDGSRDDTYATLTALAASEPRLRLIELRRNYGQTAALSAGFDHARGEVIVPMDGDLQNDPRDI